MQSENDRIVADLMERLIESGVSGGCAPRGIQLDGWKFQGSRSSMRLLGWPFAIASSVALR